MSTDSKTTSKSWNPWIGIAFAIVAFFGAQLIVGILFSIYPLTQHWSQARANNWLTNNIYVQFFTIILFEALAFYLLYLYLKRYKTGLKDIGAVKPKWIDPVLGLLALPVYFAIYFVVLGVVTHFVPSLNVNEKQQLGFNSVHGAGQLFITFISLVILPPLIEETVFRGLIYSSLRKKLPLWKTKTIKLPFWAAAVITSLLFASPHLLEGGSAGLLYVAGIDTFCLSMVLVFLREKTGRLYSGMTLHALKNLVAFLALFALHLT
jgi:membrane protease YdiL (CAAX protease family)